MPPPPQTMNQAQLKAAIQELDQALVQGDAELKQDPKRYKMLTELVAELKKAKPGAALGGKLLALLQSFLTQQVDDEVKAQKKLLEDVKKKAGDMAAQKAGMAHSAALKALSEARHGIRALNPELPPAVSETATTRMQNANAAAAQALSDAEAAAVFAKPPPRK